MLVHIVSDLSLEDIIPVFIDGGTEAQTSLMPAQAFKWEGLHLIPGWPKGNT